MKKLICIFLCTITIFEMLYYLGILASENIQSKEVFQEQEKDFVRQYQIDVTSIPFTTKNIPTFFKERLNQIIKLFPNQKLVIEDEKIEIKTESFLFYGMERLEQEFQKILMAYGLEEDSEKIDRMGVSIAKVQMYLSDEEIEQLTNVYQEITFNPID